MIEINLAKKKKKKKGVHVKAVDALDQRE